jgi:hypothetical protein
MSLALSHPTPAIEGLFPATLVGGLGRNLDDVREALRLAEEQTHPSPDGSVVAELPVPGGTWRIWPEHGVAAWLGRRSGDLPRVNDATPVALDLPDAVRHLHDRGLWCVEVRLFDAAGWSRPMDAYDGLCDLVARAHKIEGISAIFSSQSGPVRVEMYRDGRVLAADPLDAERWLLIAHDIGDAC